MRQQDWPEKLYAFLDARHDMPFDWATNSCVSFAADAVNEMTGTMPELPTFATAAEAAALLATRSLRDRVNDQFGPEIAPAFAQRGDLVLIDLAGRESIAVCVGVEAAGPGDTGLLMAPMSAAVAAWRV